MMRIVLVCFVFFVLQQIAVAQNYLILTYTKYSGNTFNSAVFADVMDSIQPSNINKHAFHDMNGVYFGDKPYIVIHETVHSINVNNSKYGATGCFYIDKGVAVVVGYMNVSCGDIITRIPQRIQEISYFKTYVSDRKRNNASDVMEECSAYLSNARMAVESYQKKGYSDTGLSEVEGLASLLVLSLFAASSDEQWTRKHIKELSVLVQESVKVLKAADKQKVLLGNGADLLDYFEKSEQCKIPFALAKLCLETKVEPLPERIVPVKQPETRDHSLSCSQSNQKERVCTPDGCGTIQQPVGSRKIYRKIRFFRQ